MGRKRSDNPDRAMRKCLRCEKKFESEGIGNRLCLDCKYLINKTGYVTADTYGGKSSHVR